MMAAAGERRDVRSVIADTRAAADRFEEQIREFAMVLAELEAQAALGREHGRRKGRL